MAVDFIKNRFKSFYHSLSGKFIIASVLVGIILILSSAATQFYINQSSTEATLALEKRLNKLNETRIIMDNIWDVSYFLEEDSIAPSQTSRDIIFSRLRSSINRLSFLIDLEEKKGVPIEGLRLIAKDLDGLVDDIHHLLELRSNPAKLYPAIQISRSSMFRSQNLFSNLIGLSIDEAISSLDDSDPEALIILMELRYRWSRLVSFYRMYLVNRLALLDDSELVTQVQNIEIYLESINNVFLSLEQLDSENRLEFQAVEALPELKAARKIWVGNFRKIVSANTPEKWRTDYPIIKTKIAPRMKSIWEGVRNYNDDIENDVKNSLLDLSNVAKNTSYILMALAVVGIVVLVALFYFINNTILKPIRLISAAMRQEARDGRYFKPLLIKGKSQETENLIDAFSIMQLQVHSRKSDLEYQTLHDSLTNLPNRLLLFDRLQQTISQAKRNKSSLALIMMDLDRFKEINDTLGHHSGDVLLQKVSNRLVDALRQVDTVARLGGDEFAVLIPDCDEEHSIKVAMKIRECMLPAIQINDRSLYIRGSLGIAIYPDHGKDPETLLKNADISMYISKRNNSPYEIYSYEHDMHSINKLEMKYKLQKAIDNNELQLYFQPQIDCRTKEVIGVEALLRWIDHDGEFIIPDVFIPMAEECGLIKSLTEWVIEEAIKQSAVWEKDNIDVHMSVNLSARNLLDPDLDSYVFDRYKKYGLESGRISFEITESAMMEDADQALKIMKSLNGNGFNLIVDDYGTGFSSLAYLKKFPITELKIDKSFVLNMFDSDEDAMIVKSTIDLAHNLGLSVIAEGVETQEILDMLNALNCDMAQGYFIGRPVAVDEFEKWYASYPSLASA